MSNGVRATLDFDITKQDCAASGLPLSVDLSPVADLDHEVIQGAVLNVADEPVVADPIAHFGLFPH